MVNDIQERQVDASILSHRSSDRANCTVSTEVETLSEDRYVAPGVGAVMDTQPP